MTSTSGPAVLRQRRRDRFGQLVPAVLRRDDDGGIHGQIPVPCMNRLTGRWRSNPDGRSASRRRSPMARPRDRRAVPGVGQGAPPVGCGRAASRGSRARRCAGGCRGGAELLGGAVLGVLEKNPLGGGQSHVRGPAAIPCATPADHGGGKNGAPNADRVVPQLRDDRRRSAGSGRSCRRRRASGNTRSPRPRRRDSRAAPPPETPGGPARKTLGVEGGTTSRPRGRGGGTR